MVRPANCVIIDCDKDVMAATAEMTFFPYNLSSIEAQADRFESLKMKVRNIPGDQSSLSISRHALFLAGI